MKENIFADLYNKVMSFFVTSQEEEEQTKVAAMSRLKTVLMQDRAGFSERAIQMLKDDMLECIAKYMEIEEDSFDLQISPEDDKTVLMLSIPVLRAKTDEEIDEAIKKDEEKAHVKAKEIVEQLEGIIEEKVQELSGDVDKQEEDKSEDQEEKLEEDIEETLEEDKNVLSEAQKKEAENTEDVVAEENPNKNKKSKK